MGFMTALVCGFLFWLMQVSMLRIGGLIGVILMVLLAIATFVVWSGGFSAVGVLLMDKARGLSPRSIGDAAMFGLASVPKFLLLGVLVFVAVLGFMLVAALLYFICKIPFLGALLAFVVHPVLVLIAAAAIIGCIWVVFPLFAPAVWSGLSFRQALSSVFAIARTRLVEVVLMMMVLYIIIVVICMLVMSGLFPAITSLTGLASSIMGGGAGYGAYGGMGAAMSVFSSSSMIGAMLGVSVLGGLVFALLALVSLMGMNLLYLQVSSGLDAAGTESDLEDAFGAMKDKAREAADKARGVAERAKQAATDRAQINADRAQANAAARAEAVYEQTRLEEEETQQPLPEQEELRREAAEREAREAQARADAQRQAAASAAAQATAPAPLPPAAASSTSAGAAALAGLVTGAATSAGAEPPAPSAPTKLCKACGHVLGTGDMFCENCGAKQ
ncbi:zinc ribbon domain-containing protein [Diaphorobacter aerolatus]|uniref:Zinc ribbon domain-containing protein n=1 Tax=Diaphorobacter aerolatus TaxID=1288495 RepID=A0A7H0GKB7_9BURK|nr:zinc ribbon domain-containing protein [Diaphorobacter aerolatus]QNP48733.1 zinc ribbon domain-containing protein [Diaphorobacter aerolatus]